MHVGVFQALPAVLGGSRGLRGLEGPPGASRGLQEPPEEHKHGFERKNAPAAYKASNLGEAEISRGMD